MWVGRSPTTRRFPLWTPMLKKRAVGERRERREMRGMEGAGRVVDDNGYEHRGKNKDEYREWEDLRMDSEL
jgi:hypothetical protein